MKKTLITILLIILCVVDNPYLPLCYQGYCTYENRANLDSLKIKSQSVRIVFYNVENLYDPYDDSATVDEEFTPDGAKRWNWSKFRIKLNKTAKTLLCAGEWSPPAIIGLCEIENAYVLKRLVYDTPLKTWKYKFVHHESPDRRGVDVAMLYRPALFQVLEQKHIVIRFPFDTLVETRELLVVQGVLLNHDTIHVMVNHWPSRRGGYLVSQPRRNYVASVLRKVIDSIQGELPAAKIIIMGDFNDEPEDESLKKALRAQTMALPGNDTTLYNLMGIRNRIRKEGTLKYRDQWSTFDQFIITGALLNGSSGLSAGPENITIFKPGFLLEEDNTYFGDKLNRTYSGPRYHGGFSDHLPVILELIRK